MSSTNSRAHSFSPLFSFRKLALAAALGLSVAGAFDLVPHTAAALPAAVQSQIDALPSFRWNNAHLVLPAEWKKGLSPKSQYVLQHESRKEGVEGNKKTERLEIELGPAFKVNGDLMAIVKADRDAFVEAKRNYRDEKVVEGKTKQGYKSVTHSFTVDSDMEYWKTYYFVITHLDGGEWSQSFIYRTTTTGFRDRFQKTYDDMIDTAILPSAIKLADPPTGGKAAGRKPLNLYTVYELGDFVEWLLELPLTQAQRDLIRDHFVDAWKRGDVEEMDGVDELYKAREELDKLDEKKKELARQMAREEAMKIWRDEAAKGDKTAKMVVDLYDAANQPIAKGKDGEPNLSRQGAEATLEVLYFVASKVDGFDTTPTPERKAEWNKQLAGQYAAMSAEQKKTLAEMPITWAALRAAWAELTEEQRKQATAEWAQTPAVKELAGELRKTRNAAGDAMRALSMQNEMRMMSQSIMSRTDYFRSQTMQNMSSSYSYRYR